MGRQWLIAFAGLIVGAGAGIAQEPQVPPVPPLPVPAVPSVQPRPGELPPLLPVPPREPLPEVPRPGNGSAGEYDPGYLYLPERAPERVRRRAEECGPAGRWWIAPSFELAWVPTNSAANNVRLRVPDPVSLFGTVPGPVVPVAGRSSGRFDAALGIALGHWFGESNTDGVDASFFLRDAQDTFGVTSPGVLVLFPRGRGQGAPQVVAFPEPFGPRVIGSFPVTLGTFFTTVDVNYRHRLFCDDSARLDALVGYRFAYLEDELYLGDVADGNSDYKRNRVSVSNPFHAGQVGLAGEYRGAEGWYVAGSAKVAFGVVSPEARTSGLFVGAEGRAGNGFRRLAALNSVEEDTFAVMPTFNVSVGRQVSDHARVFAGYTFQYLSRVGRLGDALAPANGGIPLTDFWVQSIGLGFEWRF
jgi:hypothetical protein